mmetsp:Transcript_33014/g.72985  ORF Transcript_33014/g.72985 Transcript_33014/m.72985 type:complete len:127 (+) Transcript_33014:695-1075(+)
MAVLSSLQCCRCMHHIQLTDHAMLLPRHAAGMPHALLLCTEHHRAATSSHQRTLWSMPGLHIFHSYKRASMQSGNATSAARWSAMCSGMPAYCCPLLQRSCDNPATVVLSAAPVVSRPVRHSERQT